MILEQAFINLPEILTGYGFPSQEYEGGIVGAYSLALLQELNGRNVNNPISLMQLEKPFRRRATPFIAADGSNRYLRCDLHLNCSPTRVGSHSLSAYGWRHSNWLEAKFFRAFDKDGNPKKSSNMVANTASLIVDLIRLLTLVPLERSKKDGLCVSGRYLLHVYLNRPEDHITTRRQQGGVHAPRPWVTAITQPGHQELPLFRVSDETDGVKKQIGRQLRDVSVEVSFTNFELKPLADLSGHRAFACYLTRVDAFRVAYGVHWWSLDATRSITASSGDAYRVISDFVGKHISVTSESDERKPSVEEEPEEDDLIEVDSESGEDVADASN